MRNFLKFFENLPILSWINKRKVFNQKVVLTRKQKDLIEYLRKNHSNCLMRILVGDLETLVPSEIFLRRFRDPFRDLFEGLTVFDSYGNLVGGMAERWEKEPLETVWKFFIRKNAKWSDGQLICAEDFVWGWQSVFKGFLDKENRKKNFASLSSLVKILSKIFPLKNGLKILNGELPIDQLGVRAVSKRILEVEVERPVNELLFLSELSDQRWFPLRQEYLTQLSHRIEDLSGDEAKTAVSNGAFCLKHWHLKKEIELVKNPYYYAANKVFWPRVKYLLLNDPQTRVQLWDSGYIDLYPLGEIEKSYLEFEPRYLKRMKHVPANAIAMLVCNLRCKKLQNVNVRHAFNMLFPRHELRRFILSAQWVIYGCLSLDDLPLKASKPYWISFSIEERIAEARRLLQNENFSEEEPLHLEVNHFISHDDFEKIFLAPFLKVPELKISLIHIPGEECFKKLSDKNFEICMYAQNAVSKHCLQRFLFYCSKKASHGVESFSGYENPRFDELVFSLYHNSNLSLLEQKEIYEELDKILVEDVPSFPWVLDSVSVLISDRILSASFFRWNYSSGAIYSKNLILSET